mgnify:FL=1|jgi:hypothetical protein
MVSITTEVDVYMDDFDDQDLIEELKDRGYYVSKGTEDCRTPLELLYEAWVYKTGDYEDLFRKFCQENIGRSF